MCWGFGHDVAVRVRHEAAHTERHFSRKVQADGRARKVLCWRAWRVFWPSSWLSWAWSPCSQEGRGAAAPARTRARRTGLHPPFWTPAIPSARWLAGNASLAARPVGAKRVSRIAGVARSAAKSFSTPVAARTRTRRSSWHRATTSRAWSIRTASAYLREIPASRATSVAPTRPSMPAPWRSTPRTLPIFRPSWRSHMGCVQAVAVGRWAFAASAAGVTGVPRAPFPPPRRPARSAQRARVRTSAREASRVACPTASAWTGSGWRPARRTCPRPPALARPRVRTAATRRPPTHAERTTATARLERGAADPVASLGLGMPRPTRTRGPMPARTARPTAVLSTRAGARSWHVASQSRSLSPARCPCSGPPRDAAATVTLVGPPTASPRQDNVSSGT